MSSTSVKQSTTYLGGTRQQLSEEDVVSYARQASFGVPAGFVVGMAKRESNWCPNQIDTDYDENGNPRAAKTYGLCMVTRAEAVAALSLAALSEDDLCDPEQNISVLCSVMQGYRAALEVASGGSYTDDDMMCYLAWAHNNGIGAATKSVVSYGLDWAALKARPQNDYMTGRLIPYAEEILSYAQRYPDMGGDASGADGGTAGYDTGSSPDGGGSARSLVWPIKLVLAALAGLTLYRYATTGRLAVPRVLA